MSKMIKEFRLALTLTVLVAGLGYFVDLFDLTLFSVVRVASLHDLGATDPLTSGVLIYNSQMFGMMIGGIIWGRLGDRRGRLSILMGSILLYTLANFANVFAWNVASYAVIRFFGGVGLAGELGAAITLVAESLPRERRGLGTTIVATLGMFGILVASKIGQLLSWRMAYAAGAVMGVLLLLTRFRVRESELFKKSSSARSSGDWSALLKPPRFKKYVGCILVGIPLYFTTGVLFTFAPELTAGLHVQGNVTAGDALFYGSLGLALGDFLSGLLSQVLHSRRLAIGAMLMTGFVLMWMYMSFHGLTPQTVYAMSFLIGLSVGYWAMLVTIAAEQFGTNIRATVATTVPNFVRGSAIAALTSFSVLKNVSTSTGPLGAAKAALIVGTICFALALASLFVLDETFSRDLDYVEPS